MESNQKSARKSRGEKSVDKKERSVSKSAGKSRQSRTLKSSRKSQSKSRKSNAAKNSTAKKQRDSKSAQKDSSKKSQSKQRKSLKDEHVEAEDSSKKPTKAVSAYLYYSNETIPKIKQDEGISHREAMGKAGKIWSDLTEEEKKPYDELHHQDVKR